MTTRTKWIVAGTTTAGVLALVAVLGLWAARMPFSSETLRVRLVDALSARLDAEVELGSLRLRLLPTLHAEGSGLVIRHRARRDVPPLISIGTFNVDATLTGAWNRRVRLVQLDNLVIQIPPRDKRTPEEAVENPADADDAPEAESTGTHAMPFVIDEVRADEARLVILRREPEKPSRVWQMHRLKVETVGAGTAMPFDATITNAVPPGRIDTQGTFGPWAREDPGLTPLNGLFTFHDADLGVFKGISGLLQAHGTYVGSLDTISVTGETETPDFTVRFSGHPVPLTTKYHAVVDGTNGNTTLERVDARFLDTSLVAKGGVYELEGRKGREVRLDVTFDKGRLEDVLKLAVKAPESPMTGALSLTTKFVLPPGDIDVVEKLQLDGQFTIDGGRFTNADVQKQINELSIRASGKLGELRKQQQAAAKGAVVPPPASVNSDFRGQFRLGKGVLSLRSLAFDIPGAAVRLNGQYDLPAEQLNFKGDLLMDARVSQTVTGWKSWLLKVVDPLFREEGHTVVPITITGPRGKPSFGLDMGRVF